MSKKNAIVVTALIATALIFWLLFEMNKKDKRIKELEGDMLKKLRDKLNHDLELTDEIKDQIVSLAKKYKDVNPKIAIELSKILNLTQIADKHTVIDFLVEEIENVLRESYEGDVLFKQWISHNGNANHASHFIEYATKIDLISSSEVQLLDNLKGFRNNNYHTNDTNLLAISFLAGIETILRLDKIRNYQVFSVGYGNRKVDNFIQVLKKYQVNYLIDVRSIPASKYNPDYNRPILENYLMNSGVKYVFMGELLGGRPNDNSCYVDGKVDYLKLREKDFFKDGIKRIKTAYEKNIKIALMCSEIRPQDCHRTKLIGKELINEGINLVHIDEHGKLKTQEDALLLATKGLGDTNLFGENNSTSRKKYV